MHKILLPLILISMTGLFAQPGMGAGMGAGMGRMSWDNELNLTAEQLSVITQLRSQYQAARIDNQAELKKLRLELRQLMQVERPDQKAIDATIAKIGDYRESLEKQWVGHRLEMREQLTPEQRVLFDAQPVGQGRGMGQEMGRGAGNRDMRGSGRRGGGNRW